MKALAQLVISATARKIDNFMSFAHIRKLKALTIN